MKTKVFLVVCIGILIGMLVWDTYVMYHLRQPADTVLWMNYLGQWRRVGTPLQKYLCEETVSHLQEDNPDAFFICVRKGVHPWGTIRL